MKFYLSSYKLGGETDKLKTLVDGRKIAFIPNAIDHIEQESRKQSNEKNMKDLSDIGIDVEMLDLKDYFGKKHELQKKIEVEFGSEDEARAFQVPDWYGEEITDSMISRDSKLLDLNDEEFKNFLEEKNRDGIK